MPTRIGVDIGGTFTDLYQWDGRGVRVCKVPSTDPDFAGGVMSGLRALAEQCEGGRLEAGHTVVHGSTVATNALLTRRGARIGLVATKGFRDVLHIGRQNRPELYNLHVRRPPPIVQCEDCYEVDERVGADGTVVIPLDVASARRVLETIAESGVDSVAVCLLFSFLNPRHEQAIAELAAEMGLSVTLSSELLPEFREYERTSTTAVNAYVKPVARDHYERIEGECRGLGTRRLNIMQSNGGQISVRMAGREPVRTILSGPAGGVVAGLHHARLLGLKRVVTYDMGGTSTDVCLCDEDPALTTEAVIAACPIRVPMIDIHTIGAGGGSIARIDEGGALQVGPQSAGANPGPACYGRGETPTVTDANLVLGRIVPERFLGGRFPLDSAAAERAVGELATRMHCLPSDAALGIVAVADAHMTRAVKRVTAERGTDPSELALCSFGGAGALHACSLATALNMPAVIVPPNPGILSATGMLLADLIKDFSTSLPGGCLLRSGVQSRPDIYVEVSVPPALQTLREAMGDLMNQAARAVQLEGYEQDDSVLERYVDMRYQGQSHELTVPLESLTDVDRLLAPFHAEHERRFGHAARDETVQLVTARIRAVVAIEKPELPAEPAATTPVEAARIASRRVMFDAAVETPVYDRDRLQCGHEFAGPALVVEDHATTLLPREWRARVEPTLALYLWPRS
ncbi:MAG: hydantoinase/oxoprolinase family protein [Phycisphaerales bacterium]|nr:MAG: hydantoinase/oxoprolinase family protein [Phycisphaerales bacterium]